MAKIGLGIVTCDRPSYFSQVVAGVTEHLSSVEFVCVYNDGSHPQYDGEYEHAYAKLGADRVEAPRKNKGVAKAKNWLLATMLAHDCDWLFLSEDDMVVQSPDAIRGYLHAAETSGFEHLSFHGHGPANPRPNGHDSTGTVDYWPNMVAPWSLYSRCSLETCGLMDEGFVNAWEHCEHTQRLATQGFTSPWPHNADAHGSEHFLAEIPGSIENSVIRKRDDWTQNIQQGREYWRRAHPQTYFRVFPGG